MERKKKNTRFNQALLAILIAVIMISSVAGYMFGTQDVNPQYRYNGYTFIAEAGGYYTTVLGHRQRFDYLPGDINRSNIDTEALARLKATRMIYFTSNYSSRNKESIAAAEYYLSNGLQSSSVYPVIGFVEPANGSAFPMVQCSNATSTVPVVSFMDSNATRVFMEGNCIIAQAEFARDYLLIKDAILYSILGITQ